ncbi:MAG TPA: CocE/NonD family hydrolase [Actinomycetes bacterium]|nr:CocE/NonD family hydrolase [Actinomycetes bacterium]
MADVEEGRVAEVIRLDTYVPVRDGAHLAVSLWLPDEALGPQPCLLEALPYRKDDLTASYRPEYVRLCRDYGYVVARLDLRGTGSSEGMAVDEYPEQEREDLADVIGWISEQAWSTGNVGMFGTSYSAFNSLQMAAQSVPALKAVLAIYGSDDRYADDVHWMGGALRLLDLVDYCHYMTAMNALPPVPAVWASRPAAGDEDATGWREEWLARVDAHQPWLLTWLAHQLDDEYWRAGSIRADYAAVSIPVMIVAGWADGYRNNTFRTVAALESAGTPHRLLVGPWSHMAASTSYPGPRIDLVPEMVRWWDRWLRGIDNGVDREPSAVWYVRRPHAPEPDLVTVPGEWRAEDWPSPRSGTRELTLLGRRAYPVVPDVGTAAWISCAGHLPYGQPLDQRHDDADSLTWDFDAVGVELAGNPVLRLSVATDGLAATVSAKLCSLAPDGTSTLITRGVLDLTRRGGLDRAEALEPGEAYDVEIELEATAWRFDRGHRLRLSVAGADWPNTVAPPRPVTLDVRGGTLVLPVMEGPSPYPVPTFVPGEEADPAEGEGVTWRVERDVLRRETACVVDHGSEYETPYGSAVERYWGRVSVDTRTFEQRAQAEVSFTLRFDEPAVEVVVRSRLDVRVSATEYAVHTDVECFEDAKPVAERRWRRVVERQP